MQKSSHIGFGAVLASALATILVAVACVSFATPAYAVTAAEKAAEAQDALNQLNAMQQTLEEASNNYYACLVSYQEATTKVNETQARIDEIAEQIAEIQGRLGTRAREMYRNGSASFVDMLLGAASFDELAQNWDMLNRLNESDAELSAKERELKVESEEQHAVLQEQAAIAEQKANDAATAYSEAEALVVQMEEAYNSLSAEAQALYAQEQAAAAAAATTGGVMNDDGTVTDIQTGTVYSSASEYSAATGNAIVDRALSMLGAAYEWGGVGANGAFDCSGLVSYAITGSYTRLGTTTTFMGYNQVSDPQPGDICVNEGHTGIYLGDGQMVHAADYGIGVVVGNVQSGMIYVRP